MTKQKNRDYLKAIRNGEKLTLSEQIKLIIHLSIPAIIAQLSSVIMQYIDASMVGSLGADKVAAIGLVASSTWLLGSVVYASVVGFTVQVAQAVGAKDEKQAQKILALSFKAIILLAGIFVIIGVGISPYIPYWLGGSSHIAKDASIYFEIYSIGIMAAAVNALAGGMLQSSGNMRIPGLLNTLMCVFDVIFNFFFIFPSSYRSIGIMKIYLPGMGLGVCGAAIGTALAELVTALFMLVFLFRRFSMSRNKKETQEKKKIALRNLFIHQDNSSYILEKAFKIAAPVAFEHFVVCLAMVVTTRIIAPLGVVSIAANSLAITAESLCYMPGYGMAEAATTLVGQSVGAKRKKEAKEFAYLTTLIGMGSMVFLAALMYALAPFMIGILTRDPKVLMLGVRILRIEAFAEPFYIASIIASGALRGAGDTLVPSLFNFVSLWLVRIPLSYFLAKNFGLTGVWIAMCTELIFRGTLLLIRLFRKRWLKKIDL